MRLINGLKVSENVKIIQCPEHVLGFLFGSRFIVISGFQCNNRYEPSHEKTCVCQLRTTKVQISLRIRAV